MAELDGQPAVDVDPEGTQVARCGSFGDPVRAGEKERLAPDLRRCWIGPDDGHRKQSFTAWFTGDRVDDVMHRPAVDPPRSKPYRGGRAGEVGDVKDGNGFLAATGILDPRAPTVPAEARNQP